MPNVAAAPNEKLVGGCKITHQVKIDGKKVSKLAIM